MKIVISQHGSVSAIYRHICQTQPSHVTDNIWKNVAGQVRSTSDPAASGSVKHRVQSELYTLDDKPRRRAAK